MAGSFPSAYGESIELAEKQTERKRRKWREEFNKEMIGQNISEFPCPMCWFVPCPSLGNVISKIVPNSPKRAFLSVFFREMLQTDGFSWCKIFPLGPFSSCIHLQVFLSLIHHFLSVVLLLICDLEPFLAVFGVGDPNPGSAISASQGPQWDV